MKYYVMRIETINKKVLFLTKLCNKGIMFIVYIINFFLGELSYKKNMRTIQKFHYK